MDFMETQEIITQYQMHPKDKGSAPVQIALMTQRITSLTEHFKVHKKDHAGKRGLLGLVSKRRSLLTYLRKKDSEKYAEILKSLSLRK
jgi:small subunit ribosomal protein S15